MFEKHTFNFFIITFSIKFYSFSINLIIFELSFKNEIIIITISIILLDKYFPYSIHFIILSFSSVNKVFCYYHLFFHVFFLYNILKTFWIFIIKLLLIIIEENVINFIFRNIDFLRLFLIWFTFFKFKFRL